MNDMHLINASCADQEVDVVVNAANDGLWAGGGICGVIFRKAGMSELKAACSKYKTPLRDGQAVITPAFNMKNAKAIIHAVGPDFARTPKAFKELYEAYYNSLVVLKEHGYHSISFPLISSGIFGGSLRDPVGESTKQCMRAYKNFTEDYPDYEIDVKLCAYTASEMDAALKMWESMRDEIVRDTAYDRWSAGAGAVGKADAPFPYDFSKKEKTNEEKPDETAETEQDEFAPKEGDMVFDEEEQAILDAAVKKRTEDAMKAYDEIEKTW